MVKANVAVAAVALGFAGTALGAPCMGCTSQAQWDAFYGKIPDDIANAKRNLWCPPDQEGCNGPPTATPVPLPEPISVSTGETQEAKRVLENACQQSGVNAGIGPCQPIGLPEPVKRFFQNHPDKRQEISCMAVGCPTPAGLNTPVEKRQDITCMGLDCPTPAGVAPAPANGQLRGNSKRQDMTCMGTGCPTLDSLKEEHEKRQDMACMSLDCPKPPSLQDVTRRQAVTCMAVGCPTVGELDPGFEADPDAQEAANSLSEHMSSVPVEARQAATCMAIGICDPMPATPQPGSQTITTKRITAPEYAWGGAGGPSNYVADLATEKKRITAPEYAWGGVGGPSNYAADLATERKRMVPSFPPSLNINDKRVPPPDVLAGLQNQGVASGPSNYMADLTTEKRVPPPDVLAAVNSGADVSSVTGGRPQGKRTALPVGPPPRVPPPDVLEALNQETKRLFKASAAEKRVPPPDVLEAVNSGADVSSVTGGRP